jgi:Flp pilus assembly CpaE family ATPase/TPR repeat protein
MCPLEAEDLVQTACKLFAQADRSRVIAVMGARGGVGASTIAHNLAWTIAERLDAPTALVDLDIGFGAAAASFKLDPKMHVTDLIAEDVDDEAIDSVLTRAHDRLLVVAAPGVPNLGIALESRAVSAMVGRVRRTSAFVVVDVPHVWTAWVRDVLVAADEVLLVASPDLASLRNTDNLMKLLRQQRGGRVQPAIALTMTGVPKRPEISLKDFSEVVHTAPAVTLAFEPDVYGEAEQNGRIVCDMAPKSKAAQAIEVLACGFTGRSVVERRAKPKRDVAEASAKPDPLVLMAADAMPVALPETEALVAEVTPDGTPLVVVDHANEDGLSEFERAFVEKARRRALVALETKRKAKRRMRGSRIMVRFLGVGAAAYALGWVTLWSSEQQALRVEAAPARAEAVSLPAPALDPFVALDAQYEEAITLLSANDPRGVELLTRVAEAGLAPAQYRLAKLYENGENVAADPIMALRWTERAAASGNVRAMHDLGFYYARGDAARVDEAAAFRWFRQAAEFGFADSQYNLGILYQQGRGVSADIAEALFWFTLASDQGDLAAQQRIADLGADISAIHIEHARTRADAFQPRAADQRANGEWVSARAATTPGPVEATTSPAPPPDPQVAETAD